MLDSGDFERDCAAWLADQFDGLTDTVTTVSPSEWAETKRYLPSSVTPLPGLFRYDVSPPMREIVDCMDVRSPVREVSVKKGAQIGATVGVLENTIGYLIDEVRSAPVIMMTADSELAKLRMESYVTPMIDQAGLGRLIRSHDETNRRKTGRTDKKVEWAGGGFLLPIGAQSANKLRSTSTQYLLEDETDAYPLTIGRDGRPDKIVEARTKGYYRTRKILRLSTPLIKGQSVIDDHYHEGDQRVCELPCRRCGEYQELRFQGTHTDTGEHYGLTWRTDEGGTLVPGSVRYVCKHCGGEHVNADKTWMLARYRWRPTATPKAPDIRSYHYPALLASAAMYPWEAIVRDYLAAWDERNNRPRDLGLLQEFYNNALGEVFEIRGDRIRFEAVSSHRRPEYRRGEIPNRFAADHAGSPVLLLTAAVDVHRDHLPTAVFGWTRHNRAFLVDYWRFGAGKEEGGDCEQLDDPATWGRLQELIEGPGYVADNGARYPVAVSFIDSAYLTDQVYQFCHQYEGGVFPVRGRDMPAKSQTVREFGQFATPFGTPAYGITVDLYKDRWSAALRRHWSGEDQQPAGYFNAPEDITDKEIKELTAEYKREKIERTTGQRKGFEWYRPSGAPNELWDLLIYASAALDVVAWDYCRNQLELDAVNWPAFWDAAESEAMYFDPDG